jgi:hypothetical protein
MQNYQSKPHSILWTDLNSNILNGKYKIPQFQREYVWSVENAAKLVDSVLNGFPIGTFIIWKSSDTLRALKNIGGLKLPEVREGEEIYYILDGQQRITSLFCAYRGEEFEDFENNFKRIYVDFADLENIQVKVQKQRENLLFNQVNLYKIIDNDLFNGLILDFATRDLKLFENFNKTRNQLTSEYSFSVIDVQNAPLPIATEIFTRINVEGKHLSLFEIMCAKTYIEAERVEDCFDLYEEYKKLKEDLTDVGFDTISSESILRCVSALITGKTDKQTILKLERDKFKEYWFTGVQSIKETIDYFKHQLNVPASRLLPYDSLIIPFSYFFHNKKNLPIGREIDYLNAIFWHTSLSEGYSSSSTQEVEKDINRVKAILDGKKPEFENTKASLINEHKLREEGEFRPGKSFIKAVLCYLSSLNPKSLTNSSEINLSNDNLIQSNSRNFHHIFPKNYLKKSQINTIFSNHIANICFMDAGSNKKFSDKAPQIYLNEYKENGSLEEALKSHLMISSIENVAYNDVEDFCNQRIKAIVDNMRIMIRGID